MERISLRVDLRLKQQLESEARELGISPSEIVRQVLEQHLRERKPQPNARQLAEQLGILGSAIGLPVDLSTNPTYMEGFGSD